MDKVVFLDRDGTINAEVDYLYRPEDLKLLPGVVQAIRMLNAGGYRVVVVTNQAGVARGYYTEQDVIALHEYLNEILMEQGAHIDHFFYCPHHPQHGIGEYKKECGCRKPKPGLLCMAEQFYEVDKAHSYMVGDNTGDMGAAVNYGVQGILVSTGYGSQIHQAVEDGQEAKNYDFYAETIMDAVQWITDRERRM